MAPKSSGRTRYRVGSVDQSRRLHLHQGGSGRTISLLSNRNWRQNWLNINPIVFSQPSLGQTQRSENQLNQFLPLPPVLGGSLADT